MRSSNRYAVRRVESFRLHMVELESRIVPAIFNEIEANNTTGTANAVSVPVGDILTNPEELTIVGSISAGTDVDFFSFSLGATSGVFFDIDSRDIGLSTTLNTVLTVYNSVGTQIGTNDNGYDFDGVVTPVTVASGISNDSSYYMDLAAGTYFVRVSSASSTTGNYNLNLLADTNFASAVPVLNTNAGATDTLYLDFDGHAATDSWGTYTTIPYDFNANGAVFSPAERLAIYNVVQVVGEDYSPFQINVTTVNPGSFNNGQAHRQVITNSDPAIFGLDSGTLGVAFLNAYAGGAVNTAFTFGANFGYVSTEISGRIVAQTVEIGNTSSHEFGHTLGLNHYNTSSGTGSVIPNGIMSTPDNGFNREIWSAGTNTSSAAQNDVAIISNTTNAIFYRVDDHGGTTGTATILNQTQPGRYSSSGVIAQLTEVDFFRFQAVGQTTINIDVNDHYSNLDTELRLYNSGGTLLATADLTTSFDATLTQTLTNGTYFIEVRSDGENGEHGQYTVNINTQAEVNSIALVGAAATNASSVQWTVNFSGLVGGLSASNFSLVPTGSVSGATITGISNVGSVYTVTANTGTGSGTLGLSLVNSTGVTPLIVNTPFAGPSFTIDKTAPTVTSFKVLYGTNKSYDLIGSSRITVPWAITGLEVTFSENVTGSIGSLTGVSSTSFTGSGTNTLRWNFSSINLGVLNTNLLGSGGSLIADAVGNALFGGTGFSKTIRVLLGDFTGDGIVNSADLVGVRNNQGGTNIFADIDGDGDVDNTDILLVRSRLGTSS